MKLYFRKELKLKYFPISSLKPEHTRSNISEADQIYMKKTVIT